MMGFPMKTMDPKTNKRFWREKQGNFFFFCVCLSWETKHGTMAMWFGHGALKPSMARPWCPLGLLGSAMGGYGGRNQRKNCFKRGEEEILYLCSKNLLHGGMELRWLGHGCVHHAMAELTFSKSPRRHHKLVKTTWSGVMVAKGGEEQKRGEERRR